MDERKLIAYFLIALLIGVTSFWAWTTHRREVEEKRRRHGPRMD